MIEMTELAPMLIFEESSAVVERMAEPNVCRIFLGGAYHGDEHNGLIAC